MGRTRGTQKPPIVVDGSPARKPYKRPTESVLADYGISPMTLYRAGEDGYQHEQVLHAQIWEYRGKVVDFRLMHTAVVDGQEVHIARIDCCNGTVHRHAFDRAGHDLLDHLLIEELWAGDDVWERVDALFQECWCKLVDQVEANYRRWRS